LLKAKGKRKKAKGQEMLLRDSRASAKEKTTKNKNNEPL
jgi:hypothetical protein